jgi:hypothetical protein
MKLVFTKGAAKYDRMDVIRPGEPVETVDCPKQRILPHDMMHFAVESTLNARGFLHRVKQGEAATLNMKSEDHSDAVERLVEVFQGDEWSGGTSSADELIEMYRVTCSARSCSMLPIDEDAIVAIRRSLARLATQWDAVPVGKSLELEL